jgi:hypothetical protein
MSTASIVVRLDRELTPKGFSRKKLTWNREQGPLVEVIDIQTSKGGDAVTMNVGVLSRPIYFACWGRDAEPFIEEPFCTVRARVGQLLDNKDRWWDAGGAGVADDLVSCLGTQILPFLERMRSSEAMLDWLATTGIPSPKSPLPSICFAVLQSQLGDIGAACAVLADLERKALGAWKARAHEVAVRIGCASDVEAKS